MCNFNSFCERNECEHYVIWEFSDQDNSPYTCRSCKLAGQSYDVDEIPDNCPFDPIAVRSTLARVTAERDELIKTIKISKGFLDATGMLMWHDIDDAISRIEEGK